MKNYSKQREVILTALRSSASHPTAEWVYEKSREILPHLSLATVYRNLGVLENAGEIIKVQGVFEKDRYDGNPRRHAHLVCRACGAVCDVEVFEKLDLSIIQSVDETFYADHYSLTYYGLCPYCKQNNQIKEN